MNFGPYRLLQTIKQRGPVITRRARDDAADRTVILKMLQKEGVTPATADAMQREMAMIQQVRSPRVVKSLGLIWVDDCPALVLEDAGGQVLGNLMTGAPMPMANALRVALGAAEALEAVHEAGIMHGDVNPFNLLVGDTPDQVTLIDFGLAEQGGLPPHEGAGLRGTPNYLAPELTGRLSYGADQRADLYSLGVLIYQMLTGTLPFASKDLLHLVYAHMALQPRPLRDLAPTVPDVVADLVARLMAKRPEARYQTASGLAVDLQRCLALVEGTDQGAGFVLGAADIPRKLSVSSSLQGRDAEARRLFDAFDQVRAGAVSGRSIGIEGPAGVGKSTLVTALLDYVDGNGGLFVLGRLQAEAGADPLESLVDAARRVAELLLTERFGLLESWRERLHLGMGDLMGVLPGRIPEVAALMGETGAAERLEPREAAERLTLAFRRFFRICATPEHPLVLVMEDVHLADARTLSLLDGLARQAGPERMLLVLTRRADPAFDAVPRPQTDETMMLAALDAGAVARLLSETFRLPPDVCLPLANAITEKVGGAPLTVGQFLGRLVDDGAVRFDAGQNRWTWDMAAIRAMDSSDDVVSILLTRSARLSEAERTTLGAVACIGREFSLAEAQAAAPGTTQETGAHLETAVAMGWIAPVIGLRGEARGAGLRFLHDRIRDAAQSLLDKASERAAHGRLAAHLLADLKGPPEGEQLFALARHLAAAVCPDSPSQDLARARGLNAAAGGAAIGIGDLQRSHYHFDIAAALIAPQDWADDLPQALSITAGAAGAAQLVGDFQTLGRHLASFDAHCPDLVERTRMQTLALFSEMGQNRGAVAIDVGRRALSGLGDVLPENPGPAEIQAEVGAVFAALAGRPVDVLADLPDAADPGRLVAHELMAAGMFAAFSANPMMFAVLAARLTAASIRDGLSPFSVQGFNSFGIMACGPMNQVDLGYALGQIARRIVADKGLTAARGPVDTIFNAFLRHRKEPIRDTLPGLTEARNASLASGHIQSAALASFDHAFQVFWIGERLESADDDFAAATVFCDDLKTGIYPDLNRIYRALIAALRDGPADPARLGGPGFEATELAALYHQRRDANGLSQLHLAQMLQALVFGDATAALAEGRAAARHLHGIISTPAVPAFHALFAMVATPAGGGAPDPADLPILQEGRALTEVWAAHAPQNYFHFAAVTAAEAALAEGDEAAWLEGMEAATDHASKHGFTRDSAMILERIAMVSTARERHRRASYFLRDAWRAWVHYGADAKVAALSAANRSVLEVLLPSDDSTDASMSLSLHDEQLDLGALLRATRAISQEVRLADLLRALMSGIVETAGADRAIVVAPDARQFRIVAELSAGPDGPVYTAEPDIASGRVCGPEMAPLSALRLVAQMQVPLSTGDVAGDVRLYGDPYLRHHTPKSLAIVPLINGGHLLGLVYLENSQIGAAFSRLRLNLLSALCAQAAVSWDNATLYQRQALLLEAADRFVPAELSRLFNRGSIADVQLTDARSGQMTLMVSDLRESTTQVERLSPQQTFQHINTYLRGFSRAVRAHGGFVLKYVGDGVLAVFPDGPSRAMDAAVAYQMELADTAWDPAGAAALNVGIAIHSGEVMFGVVGDETRMQIDVLSDAVNLTFRLESITKRMGARVLVSAAALKELGPEEVGRHRCRLLGEVETKGRRGLETVYELLDADRAQVRQTKIASQEAFEEGVRRLTAGDYVNACVQFSSVLRDGPADVAAFYLFQEAARNMGQRVPLAGEQFLDSKGFLADH